MKELFMEKSSFSSGKLLPNCTLPRPKPIERSTLVDYIKTNLLAIKENAIVHFCCIGDREEDIMEQASHMTTIKPYIVVVCPTVDFKEKAMKALAEHCTDKPELFVSNTSEPSDVILYSHDNFHNEVEELPKDSWNKPYPPPKGKRNQRYR